MNIFMCLMVGLVIIPQLLLLYHSSILNLAASADFLYDQLDKIPAGNYLGIFKGALVVTW